MPRRRLAVALVHYPVLDKSGAIVTSAVTNMDVHDLSRSSKTFGATDFFIVTPIEAQRRLVEAIVGHWTEGSSGKRIPSRADALALVRVVASIDEACEQLTGPGNTELWATAARDDAGTCPMFESYAQATARFDADDPRAILLLFGTSWGLSPETVSRCDARLPPIVGVTGSGGYNHLSVRSACAITLDRLTSRT
ncbi:MAG: RNA methyltransferase [Polyangiales bacterium]